MFSYEIILDYTMIELNLEKTLENIVCTQKPITILISILASKILLNNYIICNIFSFEEKKTTPFLYLFFKNLNNRSINL